MVTNGGPNSVTQLLLDWRGGDSHALDRLMPLVYDELHKLAGHYMRSERSGHTLQATALVHEAYGRLINMEVAWNDRAHFLAVAATSMRRILVDHARARHRLRRDGGVQITLDEALQVAPERPADLIDLDTALRKLEELDRRKSRAVELRFFGGLSYDEAADVLGISRATLHRDMRMALAWLKNEMTSGSDDGPG
jgi:RNA polymerase sigma factor (TIGR02999 family)